MALHATLQNICAELDQLATAINGAIPNDEPLNVAHNNWSFPGLTKSELTEAAAVLAERIRKHGSETVEPMAARLSDYPRRLQVLRTQTVGQLWANAAQAVPAYMGTLDALRRAVTPVLADDEIPHELRHLSQSLKALNGRSRALEAGLTEIEPRAAKLSEMVERIEKAHETADQLPTDLESLAEARRKIEEINDAATRLLKEADGRLSAIDTLTSMAEKKSEALVEKDSEAARIVERVHKAYTAATSHGLAAAFDERSSSLSVSMWVWVLVLFAALGAGVWFGMIRFEGLADTLKEPTASHLSIITNAVLSFISIGAPVWAAWVATKQIGQRFRLSEDYAFKAAVSRAYEGYRQEAARIDRGALADTRLEARLLESALSRLDEQPLRLVETATHGSPLHELLNSDAVREAVKRTPEFTKKMVRMAEKTVGKGKLAKGDAAAGGATE